MRRGQTTLEFVTTYGWTVLVVLLVISTLGYFGVFSPSTYLPERCDFGSQFSCVDYAIERVSTTQTQVSLELMNNFGRNVSIVAIEPVEKEHTIIACSSSLDIPRGNNQIVRCLIDSEWPAGEKHPIPLRLTFKNDESASAPDHNVTGEVYATIPREIRSTPLIQCSDGLDNDGDGCTDFPDDGGCTSLSDLTEAPGDCFVPNPSLPLSCVVSDICSYTSVFRMSDYEDGHAEIESGSQFGKQLCCVSNTGALDPTCSGSEDVRLLGLHNYTDAHLSTTAVAPYIDGACLSGTGGTVGCAYRPGPCQASEVCLVKLHVAGPSPSDTHVSNCTGQETSIKTTNICCEVT